MTMLQNIHTILFICYAILGICLTYLFYHAIQNKKVNTAIIKLIKPIVRIINNVFYPVRFNYRINKAKKLEKALNKMINDYKRGVTANEK